MCYQVDVLGYGLATFRQLVDPHLSVRTVLGAHLLGRVLNRGAENLHSVGLFWWGNSSPIAVSKNGLYLRSCGVRGILYFVLTAILPGFLTWEFLFRACNKWITELDTDCKEHPSHHW